MGTNWPETACQTTQLNCLLRIKYESIAPLGQKNMVHKSRIQTPCIFKTRNADWLVDQGT